MDNTPDHATVFDTDQQYLGTVYAKALMGVGEATSQTESLLQELGSLVNDLLPAIQGLKETLESPRVPFDAKAAILDKAFKGRASQEFINFLKVVCQKNRFNCIYAIHRAARKMHNEASGRLEATLMTAQEVGEDVVQRVREQLEKLLDKKIELASQVDPAIIGGLVVRVGDTVFDGSIANQLNQVRRMAIEKANLEIRQTIARFALET